MKTKLPVVCFVLIIIFSSCVKIGGPTIYPVTGLYAGYRSINRLPNQGNLPYYMIVYPDGSLSTREIEGYNPTITYYATGTWALHSKLLSYTYTTRDSAGSVIAIAAGSATFNDTTGVLNNAIWQDSYVSSNPLDSGTFFSMRRIN